MRSPAQSEPQRCTGAPRRNLAKRAEREGHDSARRFRQAQAVARAAGPRRRGRGCRIWLVLLHVWAISRVDRRRVRRRQPRATHAAGDRHGQRGQHGRHADRQDGRPGRHAGPGRLAHRAAERRGGARPGRAPGEHALREQQLLRGQCRAARVGSGARAGRSEAPCGGGQHRRGVGRRRLACPRRGGRCAGRARRRARAGAIEPCADRPHLDRTASERAGRCRQGPRRLPRLRTQYAASTRDGLGCAALGAGWRARRVPARR